MEHITTNMIANFSGTWLGSDTGRINGDEESSGNQSRIGIRQLRAGICVHF